MCNLLEDFWRCIIQSWQSCVVLNTQCRYFSMMFQRHPFQIKWFLPTGWYIIFFVLVYHKPHSIFKSKSQEFHIGLSSGNETTMAGYLMGMHRDLRMRKFLQATISSAEFISIPNNKNSPKQVGTFMTISHYRGAMYLSGLFFLFLELFDWQIVILQEWTKFITIQEWPIIALRKQYLILIIRDCYLTYRHQTIYGTSQMTKVMKKSQYQMIVLYVQKIFVLSYQTCGIKGRNVSILIMLWLVWCYV